MSETQPATSWYIYLRAGVSRHPLRSGAHRVAGHQELKGALCCALPRLGIQRRGVVDALEATPEQTSLDAPNGALR